MRRNMLDTLVSPLSAARSTRWINTKDEKEAFEPIQISYEQYPENRLHGTASRVAVGERFRHHRRLDVCYEDLVARRDEVMAQVQDFLGVSQHELQPITFKQAQKPRSVRIANFEELRAGFQGTSWAEFFVD